MRGNKSFFNNFKLSFALIISPMVQLPFLIKLKFSISDKLVIVECSDREGDFMIRFAKILWY